jgi:hypothetical protein
MTPRDLLASRLLDYDTHRAFASACAEVARALGVAGDGDPHENRSVVVAHFITIAFRGHGVRHLFGHVFSVRVQPVRVFGSNDLPCGAVSVTVGCITRGLGEPYSIVCESQ